MSCRGLPLKTDGLDIRSVPMRYRHADALLVITQGSSCTLSEVPSHRADGRTRDRGDGPGKSERRLRKLPVDIGVLKQPVSPGQRDVEEFEVMKE